MRIALPCAGSSIGSISSSEGQRTRSEVRAATDAWRIPINSPWQPGPSAAGLVAQRATGRTASAACGSSSQPRRGFEGDDDIVLDDRREPRAPEIEHACLFRQVLVNVIDPRHSGHTVIENE